MWVFISGADVLFMPVPPIVVSKYQAWGKAITPPVILELAGIDRSGLRVKFYS
jgi:hypothetical protein